MCSSGVYPFMHRYQRITYDGPAEIFHYYHAGPPPYEEHDG